MADQKKPRAPRGGKAKGAGIAAIYGNSVLLVLERSGKFGLPKGHFKKNETPAACAIREFREETDIQLETDLSRIPHARISTHHIYYIRFQERPLVAIQDSELSKAKWFSVGDFNDECKKDEKLESFNSPTRWFIRRFLKGEVSPVIVKWNYCPSPTIFLDSINENVPLKVDTDDSGVLNLRSKLRITHNGKRKEGELTLLMETAKSGNWIDDIATKLDGTLTVRDDKGIVFNKDGKVVVSRDRESPFFTPDLVYISHTVSDNISLYSTLYKL